MRRPGSEDPHRRVQKFLIHLTIGLRIHEGYKMFIVYKKKHNRVLQSKYYDKFSSFTSHGSIAMGYFL